MVARIPIIQFVTVTARVAALTNVYQSGDRVRRSAAATKARARRIVGAANAGVSGTISQNKAEALVIASRLNKSASPRRQPMSLNTAKKTPSHKEAIAASVTLTAVSGVNPKNLFSA